jgi:hypothetical protein
MFLSKLVIAAEATANGSPVILGNRSLHGSRGFQGLAQAAITGTATVKLQGRMSSEFPWVDLKEFTGSKFEEVTLMPEIRYSITACAVESTVSLAVAFDTN